jgi:predicted transcriptional regulator
MKQTTLEEYVAITLALAQQGPLKLAQLEAVTHIESVTLKKYLVFLTELGAIKEQSIKKSVAYAITPCGVRILNFFGLSKSIVTHQKSTNR